MGRWAASSLLLLFLLSLAGCEAPDRQLTLAVSTEEPAPTIAETIREFLNARNFQVSVEAISDPGEILQAIAERRIDLALIDEPDRLSPGVVTLASLYPSVLHVLYNKGGPVEDFAVLIRNSLIYAGPKGGVAQRLLQQLAADFHVSEQEYTLLDNPWTRSPDVYFIFGGLLDAGSIAQLQGYRMFSFARPDAMMGGSVADGIVLRHRYLKHFLLPRSIYYTLNDEAVMTLSIRAVLIAHEDFDADLALEIVTQLFNNAQEIALDNALVTRELNPNIDVNDLNFPLHAGTRRFLDRDKPGFIERHVDVLGLALAILAGVGSGILALYQLRKQVKKDHFDIYYSRLVDARLAAENTNESTALLAQQQRVRDVQQEVLGLLIDESITADTNLMAFLSLSNQIINELDRRITRP